MKSPKRCVGIVILSLKKLISVTFIKCKYLKNSFPLSLSSSLCKYHIALTLKYQQQLIVTPTHARESKIIMNSRAKEGKKKNQRREQQVFNSKSVHF